LLVGEAPGYNELKQGRPFVGASGRYQEQCLNRHGASARGWRMTNVVQEFREGNPDPSPALIRQWTPKLEAEVRRTRPKLVVPVGRYAARWFLGDTAEMDVVWGVPCRAGAFDASLEDRADGAVVLPIYHPAYALHSKGGEKAGEAIALVEAGYRRVADAIKKIQAGRLVHVRHDEYQGREDYRDVTGKQLADEIVRLKLSKRLKANGRVVVGFDTEGTPGNEWSLQASFAPGAALVLRTSQPDFKVGVRALQQLANEGAVFVTHSASTPQGCYYDLTMALGMGLDLSSAKLFDTMYAAYLLRLESQGAKELAWRWCGMKMRRYKDLVGPLSREMQIEWFDKIMKRDWPKPEQRIIVNNDGTLRLYKPQPVHRRVENMLYAVYLEDKDPAECWSNMDDELRRDVESELGRLPHATLDDVKLDEAVAYAGADSDFELRAYPVLCEALRELDLLELMDRGMAVAPAFNEMQRTGMPASRSAFEKLRTKMEDDAERVRCKLSKTKFGGRPFNPKSTKHVTSLLTREGLEPAQRTKKGAVSTSKGSIEHLRYTNDAIKSVVEVREKRHINDMFVEPMLAMMPEGVDICTVYPNLKTTRTTTRRLASTSPNVLAYPKHEKPGGFDYGKMVRNCFIAPSGKVFVETDLSQIESRLLAHESADPVLLDIFNKKSKGKWRDFHTETAARLFGVPASSVAKDDVRRFFAKRINFGVPYGVSWRGMAAQLRVMGILDFSDQDCQDYLIEWHKLYKQVKPYFLRTYAEIRSTGMVRSYWGMIRYMASVYSDDQAIVAAAEREAVNHKIQDGAQGMLQNALAWLYPRVKDMQQRGMDVRLCLTIHDSLLAITDEELYPQVSGLMIEALEKHNGLPMRVPCLAEAKMARTWGAL
jgi:uracil-DNA glycosylase family 4